MATQGQTFPMRKWQLPEILFVGAACFAMAAVGFFLAVFLQLRAQPSVNTSATYTQAPEEERLRLQQQFSETTGGNVQSTEPAVTDDAKRKLLEQFQSQ